MSIPPGYDECGNCGKLLPCEDLRPAGTSKTPCPRCGSTRRIKSGSVNIEVSANVRADAKLIISWHEVDRLREKAEYAAALLVAAVNVEFILWKNLKRFTPSASCSMTSNNVRSIWGKIQKDQFTKVTLSSLLAVAEYVTQNDTFVLSPTWDPVVCEISNVRNRIAHERGYFAKLTQLKDPDWPETRIREVLQAAKEFCHGNAP